MTAVAVPLYRRCPAEWGWRPATRSCPQTAGDGGHQVPDRSVVCRLAGRELDSNSVELAFLTSGFECCKAVFLRVSASCRYNMQASAFFLFGCGFLSACCLATVPGHAVQTRSSAQSLLPSPTNYDPWKDKSDRLVLKVPPDITLVEDQASRAPNLQTGREESIDKCYEACWRYAGCTHITYTEMTKFCYLKQGVPDVSPSRGAVTVSLCLLRGAGTQNDTSIPPVRVSSLGSCAGTCQETPSCSHYTYRKDTHLCYMKPGRPNTYVSPDEMVGLPCTYYERASEARNRRTIENTKDVTECRKMCREDPECTHFSYNRHSQCFLQDGEMQLYDVPEAVTEYRTCECKIPVAR